MPTTTPTTQPTTDDSEWGPYTLNIQNINDTEAIDKLAENPNYNIYEVKNGAIFTRLSYYYGDEKYTCGKNEYRLFLTLINEEYMEKETLNCLFGDIDIWDFERYAQIIDQSIIQYMQSVRNATIEYENFVISSDKVAFLLEFQDAILEYKQSGDVSNIEAILSSFYGGKNQHVNHNDDMFLDYYIVAFCRELNDSCPNQYLQDTASLYSADFDNYFNYVITSFYQKATIG